MIRKSGKTVAEYDSAREFLTDRVGRKPAPVFVNSRLAGSSGIELAGTLAAEGNEFPCVVIATNKDGPRVLAAGFDMIRHPVKEESLLTAIDRCNGPRVVSYNDLHGRCSRLTACEAEVAGLIVLGLATNEIARKLGKAIKTVASHRARIMMTLQADDIGELARKWKAWQGMQ